MLNDAVKGEGELVKEWGEEENKKKMKMKKIQCW